MNIDIQTTTIKLSKSVINQMVQASPHTIADWQVLGYVVNIVNNCSKALIIKRGELLHIPLRLETGRVRDISEAP